MKTFFFIIGLLFVQITNAQKLTGTWQGLMDEEFLQLNIVQVGDNICGYTWDYELLDKKSYCKAYFNGSYNKAAGTWFIEGYSFMEQGGGHSLMQLKFKVVYEDGKMLLKGICRITPTMFFSGSIPSSFSLEKTSSRPTIITQTMLDCMAQYEPPKKAVTPKKLTPKKQPIVKPVVPPKKAETIPVKTEKIKDTIVNKTIPLQVNTLPVQTNGRTNKELKRIVVNDKKITLNIYDNGTIDGDTVSIYYNGKAIVKNKRLTANPIVVDVDLDENIALHSIVLFAENLGSIPPNTALVIFTTAAGKRYEMYASATLQQNAEIIFEYRGK